MKQVLAFLMVLAMTACIKTSTYTRTGVDQNNEEEHAVIDPSPAHRLHGQESTTPLLKYTDSITKVYPNFYENAIAAEKMSNDFKTKLGALPGIFEGSAFRLANVMDAQGTAIVELTYDGDPIRLSVHCVGFDREKAAKLSESKQYIIKGGKVTDYQPAPSTSDVSIDFGDVFTKDLQVEEVK